MIPLWHANRRPEPAVHARSSCLGRRAVLAVVGEPPNENPHAQRDRRLVVREHVQLELAHAVLARPLGGGIRDAWGYASNPIPAQR